MNNSRRSVHAIDPQRGFTLIELMVAVLVAGVLLMIALPSFQQSQRKARRAEALSALSQLQLAQERWRANNPNYATSLADLRVPATTPGGLYGLALANVSATGYTASATAKPGTSQAQDSQCISLRVTMSGGSITYASVSAGSEVDSVNSNRCWAR